MPLPPRPICQRLPYWGVGNFGIVGVPGIVRALSRALVSGFAGLCRPGLCRGLFRVPGFVSRAFVVPGFRHGLNASRPITLSNHAQLSPELAWYRTAPGSGYSIVTINLWYASGPPRAVRKSTRLNY